MGAEPAQQTAARREALSEIRAWVKRQCGITFSSEQEGLFVARIEALCRELQLSVESLREKLLARDASVALRLVEAASTNYTFFFREPEVFRYLTDKLFPALPPGPLRFWSAAASSGDEAYSLAMLSLEQLGDRARSRVRILGTDISDRQVRIAEQGSYPRDQLAQLGPSRLARWFSPGERGQMRIADELRQMCTFRRLNLTQPTWPFEQRFHLIFLRNVLYYFEPRTRQQIVEACFDVAEPGAVLVTSLTEPILEVKTRWTMLRPAIYQKGQA